MDQKRDWRRKRFPCGATRRIPFFFAILWVVWIASPPNLPGESPERIRQKLGVYVWGRVPDLAAAASDAKAIGTDQVIRTFIGPWSDNPPFQDDLRPLGQKALDLSYQTIFHDFQVIMLTAYDSASYVRTYGSSFSVSEGRQASTGGRAVRRKSGHPAEPSLHLSQDLASMAPAEAQQLLHDVQQEFHALSLELSKLDRTFIISNWEAEHDVPDTSYWPWFTRYLQARMDGIAAGRNEARQKGYPARVFTAFEFTIIPGFQGKSSGLTGIGAKLRGVDYWSYSSWHSMGWDFDAGAMKNSFRHAIHQIRDAARQARLPQRIIIGEFGEYWNIHSASDRLKAIVEVSLEEGVAYLFNWALYEQPGEKDEWGRDASHFGKFYLDRTLTPQGKAFQEWLLGAPHLPVEKPANLLRPRVPAGAAK